MPGKGGLNLTVHTADKFKRYIRIIWKRTLLTNSVALQSRLGAFLFFIGKLLRFGTFLYFLIILVNETKVIAGYSLFQVVFFYATFNLVDTIVQLFLREVYRFRSYIVSGTFDSILNKPFSPLLRSLFGGIDLLDIPILVISLAFLIYSGFNLSGVTLVGILVFILLLVNSFLIALSFHILVLALAIYTTEIDHAVMVYRDITQMGRIPVDIYIEPVRIFLTFVIPVSIMITLPAKAIMNLASVNLIILSFSFSIILLFLSLKFWQKSLKFYQSASS